MKGEDTVKLDLTVALPFGVSETQLKDIFDKLVEDFCFRSPCRHTGQIDAQPSTVLQQFQILSPS